MAYVDNLVSLTTYIKNTQGGLIDDLRDETITNYLMPRLNAAAQKGNNTLTISLDDLTSHLKLFNDLHIGKTDYGECKYALEHAIDQLNDEGKDDLTLTHLLGLWYVIEWADNSEC